MASNTKILIKTPEQIAHIRQAWKYLTEMLLLLKEMVAPWVILIDIEAKAAEYLKKNNVKGTFIGHHGYKHNLCLSVNDCVVHGIPDRYVLKQWDLLKIDAWVTYKWLIADSAISIVVWWDNSNIDAARLIQATKWALDTWLQFIKPGKSLYDFGYAVDQYVKSKWCTIIKNLTGHGVGTSLREPPFIHNRWHPDSQDIFFKAWMVVALEPITAMWSTSYIEKPKVNNWNLYTTQWDLWAQWEYTILITETGYEILAGVV
jgi:methionyl aminopeptidase